MKKVYEGTPVLTKSSETKDAATCSCQCYCPPEYKASNTTNSHVAMQG